MSFLRGRGSANGHLWTGLQWSLPDVTNDLFTLYYAEVFTLLQIQIQIPTRMVSRMVTVPILETDVDPKDGCLSLFYYISFRGSKSKSEPMGNFCIVQQSESESES